MTYIDNCTGIAVFAFQESMLDCTSVQLQTEFILGMKLGLKVHLKATVDKLGSKVGFTRAVFYDPKNENEALATGGHVIAFTKEELKLRPKL